MATKDRILQTAATLFYHQGYQATGINQIVSDAKVAKASFYDHFSSKDTLCQYLLLIESDAWMAAISTKVNDSERLEEQINALFDHLLAFSKENQYRGCLFLNILSEAACLNPMIKQSITTHKQRLLNFFEGLFQDSDRSYHFYILYESALMESQVFTGSGPIEKARSIALKLF